MTEVLQEQGFNQATHQWHVGDKAFHNHELVTIRDVAEDGRVHGVTTDYIITGGYRMNDRIFPVDEDGQKITNFFEQEAAELHGRDGERLLNWPSLAVAIEERWVETMRHYHAGDKQSVIDDIYRAGLFFKEIHAQVFAALDIVVGGVPLFWSGSR